MSGKAVHLCPSCMTEISRNTISIACSKCGHINKRKIRLGNKCIMPNCKGEYLVRCCGWCGYELSPRLFQKKTDIRNIFVFSSFAGGKSSFVAALGEDMMKYGSTTGWKRVSYLSSSMQRAHEIERDRLYRQHERLAASNVGSFSPWQWLVERKQQNTIVTIWDFAGEDIEIAVKANNSNISSCICKAIEASNLIVLLIDPVQISELRQKMTEDECNKVYPVSTSWIEPISICETINKYANYLRDVIGGAKGERIDIPIAMVINKVDAISEISHLKASPSIYTAVEFKKRMEKNSSTVQRLFAPNYSELEKQLNANFRKWSIFFSSSYGVLPETQSKPSALSSPLCVLDPLLWQLE